MTSYLISSNGSLAQDTPANRVALPGFTVLENASDELLLSGFVAPALNCTTWMMPDAADPSATPQLLSALPLNEIQASLYQKPPVALIPAGDPMVLDAAGQTNPQKLNAFRAGVGEFPVRNLKQSGANLKQFCIHLYTVGATRIAAEKTLTAVAPSAAPDMASTLFAFLATRLNTATGPQRLNCTGLFGLKAPFTPVVQALNRPCEQRRNSGRGLSFCCYSVSRATRSHQPSASTGTVPRCTMVALRCPCRRLIRPHRPLLLSDPAQHWRSDFVCAGPLTAVRDTHTVFRTAGPRRSSLRVLSDPSESKPATAECESALGISARRAPPLLRCPGIGCVPFSAHSCRTFAHWSLCATPTISGRTSHPLNQQRTTTRSPDSHCCLSFALASPRLAPRRLAPPPCSSPLLASPRLVMRPLSVLPALLLCLALGGFVSASVEESEGISPLPHPSIVPSASLFESPLASAARGGRGGGVGQWNFSHNTTAQRQHSTAQR